MIPITDVQPTIPSPLPTCAMPTAEEISEEGFGFFRGTWFIGHVPIAEAQETVRYEREIIEWLDETASTPSVFEQLATAIEKYHLDELPEPLRRDFGEAGIERYLDSADDVASLGDLEIGVAGLTYALSAIRCLTAASCRSHMRDHSWADCPVVFFAAPAWRMEILAELVAAEGCGLGQGRDLLTVYGPSIRQTHGLANRILAERALFRSNPHRASSSRRASVSSDHVQMELFSDQ